MAAPSASVNLSYLRIKNEILEKKIKKFLTLENLSDDVVVFRGFIELVNFEYVDMI